MQTCRRAKAESCLRSICVYVVYKLNVWIKCCYCSVCDCAACKSVWKCENRSIYCITSVWMCAKAESCLCSICVYVVYELNVWIKRCYRSVCDCAACKSIWKCEKSIDLLHHICLYVRKSWIVPSQYMCICHIWAAACMLLSFCVCASFNALMITLLLLRFSTVCELNVWVKRCYCSINVDEIVQLFWQA